jgi:hypothetical protein
VKQGIVHSLYDRALSNCQEQRDFVTEVQNVKLDLGKNDYPKHVLDTTINKSGKKKFPSTQSKEACTVVIPNVKGISDQFKCIGNKYNIKTIFKTKHTLHCIYSIPCECGRRYVRETSRPLGVRIKEHKHNLKQGLLEKS